MQIKKKDIHSIQFYDHYDCDSCFYTVIQDTDNEIVF